LQVARVGLDILGLAAEARVDFVAPLRQQAVVEVLNLH
jgi:hypothetical protein